MTGLLHDLRYALRQFRKNPGFTAVAVITLGLGIGASTAIFSVVDAVLLRALPYPNPQKIVRVWEQAPDGHRMSVSDPDFDDFRAQNHTLSALAKYSDGPLSVAGGNEPVRLIGAVVSQDFFKALGVQPFLGRSFMPQEQSGIRTTIVSYDYWHRYLGGSSDLSQFHLTMNGGVYSVVGVMPRGFDFPQGTALWIEPQLDSQLPSRTAHNWNCLGRVRAGNTVAEARVDLDGIARRIRAEYGEKVDLTNASVVPLAEAIVGSVKTALLTLLGGVGLLLLVACANVAGLLLARTSSRRKELAVRTALGAGRDRLIQQFLAESLVLSFAGGGMGILIATWAVGVLPQILPANLPRQQDIAMNTLVLLFAVATMVAVSVSLGFFAAWHASTGNLQEALSADSRSYSGSGASQRLRSFLIAGEIATTLVILTGAGLLGRSFLRLISANPGFRQENLITIEFSPPASQGELEMDPSDIVRQINLLDDLLSRLRAVPGTESVGLAGAFPVAHGNDLADGTFLILNSQKPPVNFKEWDRIAQTPSQIGHALYAVASQEYFHTMGIPLIRGRMFGKQDDINSPNVAVISQALARQRWPNQDPIGQIIDFGNMDGNLRPLTIVGIVGDVRAKGLDFPPSSIIYVDYRQRGMSANSSPTILMRSAAPTGEIVPTVRDVFRDLAPDVPVRFSTFQDEIGGWLADRRFLLLLVGLFAALALILAAVGIYGVVAFSVTRRTQEIGIRMALGAQRAQVLKMVLWQGLKLAVVGVAIGVTLSLALTRFLTGLLYGVKANDPLTFAAMVIVLISVALAACYIPARRVAKVDPMEALRYE